MSLLKQFKFKLFKRITGIKDEDIDETLPQPEAHKIYLKIISLIGVELKKYGFKKLGTVDFYRVVDNYYQRINFQKSAYRPTMTANIAFQKMTKKDTLESLRYVLPNNVRLGQLETNHHDQWYPIKRDYQELANNLIKLFSTKVIPYFEDKMKK